MATVAPDLQFDTREQLARIDKMKVEIHQAQPDVGNTELEVLR
ncbi:hypothetical protein [Sphingomonas sp. BK580]|nr:hypothetical protein [Sphingomonas sp. BK580]MBB3695865.1 hypothetical protein [Sphingomonas sp. BK580]